MSREAHVQFCERLGAKLPGATLPPATREDVQNDLRKSLDEWVMAIMRKWKITFKDSMFPTVRG